jgi:hypothetical protein
MSSLRNVCYIYFRNVISFLPFFTPENKYKKSVIVAVILYGCDIDEGA